MSAPVKITVSSAASSAWVPLNIRATPFNVAIGCVCSSNINATYSVDYSHDDPQLVVPCNITRSATTATLVLVNHGLTTSDWINVIGTGSTSLDGNFKVAGVTDQNTITYTVTDAGITSSYAGKVAVMRVFTHSTLVSKTANADGNLAFPVSAVRLRLSAWVAGYVTMIVTQAGIK